MPSFLPRLLFVIILLPFSLLLAHEKQPLQPIKSIQGPDWIMETKVLPGRHATPKASLYIWINFGF